MDKLYRANYNRNTYITAISAPARLGVNAINATAYDYCLNHSRCVNGCQSLVRWGDAKRAEPMTHASQSPYGLRERQSVDLIECVVPANICVHVYNYVTVRRK